jgi:hypothetical protein
VVGDHFGLRLDRRRKVLGQHVGNAAMQLLALATQQTSVSHVTHERVLEQISRVRRQAPPKQQTRSDQSVKWRFKLRIRLPRY